MKTLSEKRAHVGLSRLARFASARGINPENIDDSAIEGFIAGVREGSLHRKLNDLHRNVTLIWNRAASQPQLRLKQVTVPSFRGLPRRIDWTLLPEAFRTDVEGYLYWCAGSDPFAADARRSPRGGRSPQSKGPPERRPLFFDLSPSLKGSKLPFLADRRLLACGRKCWSCCGKRCRFGPTWAGFNSIRMTAGPRKRCSVRLRN